MGWSFWSVICVRASYKVTFPSWPHGREHLHVMNFRITSCELCTDIVCVLFSEGISRFSLPGAPASQCWQFPGGRGYATSGWVCCRWGIRFADGGTIRAMHTTYVYFSTPLVAYPRPAEIANIGAPAPRHRTHGDAVCEQHVYNFLE